MSAKFSLLTMCALEAALKAGELLRRGFSTRYTVSLKEESQNYVTEYDLASERCIVEHITAIFPTHNFYGEEGGHSGGQKNEVVWIIDPLDGTTNFVRQIPLFAVSIAAVYGSEILSGVVYLPLLQEMFVAEQGVGAFCNHTPIHVSETKELRDAVIGVGFPYSMRENPMGCIEHFSACIRKGIPLRNLGSAATSMAYVAAGHLDAYWMPNQQPWDMAAGKLLVEEAGGGVTQYNGTPHKEFKEASVVATNSYLHTKLLDLLS